MDNDILFSVQKDVSSFSPQGKCTESIGNFNSNVSAEKELISNWRNNPDPYATWTIYKLNLKKGSSKLIFKMDSKGKIKRFK